MQTDHAFKFDKCVNIFKHEWHERN